MQMNNKAILAGTIISSPTFYTQLKTGTVLFRALICVMRLSGNEDVLPVVFSKEMMPEFEVGAKMKISGRLQTRNSNGHLDVYVRVYNINPYEKDENYVELEAAVCKEPELRTTPFKRIITNIVLANNAPPASSSYVPTIFWGRTALYMSGAKVGEEYLTYGRFQSRTYFKNGEERICYEYSGNFAEKTKGVQDESNDKVDEA